MALQTSGQISLNDVNTELGNASGTSISMGSTAVRDLFGIASGEIQMSDGYGASAVTFSNLAQGTSYGLTGSDAYASWYSFPQKSGVSGSDGSPYVYRAYNDTIGSPTSYAGNDTSEQIKIDIWDSSDLTYVKTIQLKWSGSATSNDIIGMRSSFIDANNIYLMCQYSANGGSQWYNQTLLCINISNASLSWWTTTGQGLSSPYVGGLAGIGSAATGYSQVVMFGENISNDGSLASSLINTSNGTGTRYYRPTHYLNNPIAEAYNSNGYGCGVKEFVASKNNEAHSRFEYVSTSSHIKSWKSTETSGGDTSYFINLIQDSNTDFWTLQMCQNGNFGSDIGLCKINMNTGAVTKLKRFTYPFAITITDGTTAQGFSVRTHAQNSTYLAFWVSLNNGNHHALFINKSTYAAYAWRLYNVTDSNYSIPGVVSLDNIDEDGFVIEIGTSARGDQASAYTVVADPTTVSGNNFVGGGKTFKWEKSNLTTQSTYSMPTLSLSNYNLTTYGSNGGMTSLGTSKWNVSSVTRISSDQTSVTP